MSEQAVYVYFVTDGWTDVYGVFSTRRKARAWIARQHRNRYSFADCLKIEPWPVDVASDLGKDARIGADFPTDK